MQRTKRTTMQLRVQPHVGEIEQAVIGAVIIDRYAFEKVAEFLAPEMFYHPKHGLIYAACRTLHNSGEPIDILTVTEELQRTGDLEKIGGGYYLVELSNQVASAANIEAHARIIAQKHIQRELIRIGERLSFDSYEGQDPFETLDAAQAALMGIMSPFEATRSEVTVGQAALSMLANLDRAMSGGLHGIKTGFSDLDRLSGGWFPGEFTIAAARPGMGKTEFALTAARNAAAAGHKPHFVTLEMTAEQLAMRLVSSECGVPTGDIRRADITPQQIERIKAAVQGLQRSGLTISAHRGANALYNYARKRCAKGDMDILFVDYAQLMDNEDSKRSSNRENDISVISRTLKRISTEFNVPVVALSQLNREVEKRADKCPHSADLRESGSLEQDADNIYFLVRPEVYGITHLEEGHGTPLPEGAHDTRGKMFVYSGKMRSDSRFTMALRFEDGHIYDLGIQPPNAPVPADFTVPRAGLGEDIPF